MSHNISYNKKTTTSLVILWIGAILFCTYMVYIWLQADKDLTGSDNNFVGYKNIFVDQLLLSAKDLQLGDNVNLININLNTDPDTKQSAPKAVITTPPERRLVYSKILQQKIEKISTEKTDGFTIKPLPQ